MDGRFVEVNRAFCDMHGYSEDELLGLTWAELVLESDLSSRQEIGRRLGDGGSPDGHVERQGRRKDGTLIDVEVTASVLKDGDGRPRFIDALLQDITERKRAGEAAERAAEQTAALIGLGRHALERLDPGP